MLIALIVAAVTITRRVTRVLIVDLNDKAASVLFFQVHRRSRHIIGPIVLSVLLIDCLVDGLAPLFTSVSVRDARAPLERHIRIIRLDHEVLHISVPTVGIIVNLALEANAPG